MEKNSYTARDLNRNPARVFEAVHKFGSVNIRSRTGDTYVMSLEKKPLSIDLTPTPDFDKHWQKLQQLGCNSATQSDQERINQIIAGEE